jgi:sugar lactone lactonase YvrE
MKTKILRNIFLSLGVMFALAIIAHAQNLYVSVIQPGEILEYTLPCTPPCMPSTYATGLDGPRGLGFDSVGNLFAASQHFADNHEIGRVLKFNLRNHVSTVGSVANVIFEGLAIDIASNAYVLATDITGHNPTGAGTIFEFTPNGQRIAFGTVPGNPDFGAAFGLAFDSAGNLYATDSGNQTIYKFAPDGTRTIFAGPSAFAGEFPIGLAFDSSGNLFVAVETLTVAGADSIVYFTPMGVKSTFATGLTRPRGLAFDGSGNLFVTENLPAPDGDILEFAPNGTYITTFATGLNLPQFLAFGPPR